MEVRDFTEKFAVTMDKIRHVNKDVWLLLFFILPIVTFVSCGISNENRKSRGEGCRERVAQQVTTKDPSLSVETLNKYQAEVFSQCD
jgi:hypothetical protein